TQLEVLAGAATQAGIISETGGSRPFEKIGTRMLTLSANNTYSGTTTISQGVLQVGNGGTTGTLGTGNVVNNGGLWINRSNDYTIGGIISGTGAFAQNGSGTTTLAALN